MDKRYRYIKKNGKKILSVLALFIVICLAIPFASAKYQYFYQAKSRTVTSDSFYFSIDLTGDSKMVGGMTEVASEDGKVGEEIQNLNLQEGYQFAEKEEKTYHLYGGSEHTVSIQLRNYYDSLRITQAEIGYRASLLVQDVDGKEVGTSLASIKTMNQDGTYETSQGENGSTELFIQGTLGGGNHTGSAYEMEDKELILDIERYANDNYKDGATVKLVIESTTPYKKTIELNFILHRTENYLSYEIKDSPGSAYAELIMRNNLPDGVQPYLSWSEELLIDNTNTLTYTYESDGGNPSFVQQEIESQETMKRMQLSRAIKMNESCSIYFFKSNVGQDYTKETTIVNPDSNGVFEIPIQAGNLETTLLNTNDSQREGRLSETILPCQEAALSSGRQYSGINSSNSSSPVAITNQSAFTLQFTTRYTPSNYGNMREILQTSFHEPTVSSEFTIPWGTVITMVAKINDCAPTYWYYYCTEEKSEISLSEFRPMNKIDIGTEDTYNLSTASGNQVDVNTEEPVEEELRFVFDFGNIGNIVSEMANMQVQRACAQLRHIATVDDKENIEIMNYTGQGENVDLYRSYPKTSDAWTISENNTHISSFAVNSVDVGRDYSVRDTYEIEVKIEEGLEYEDTRCDGREYAVKLELVEIDENGNIITKTFPEGMTMMYHDQQITASENNQVFILPVKSAGTHNVKLSTGLSAFCDGKDGTVTLRASLYASKDASYYNDLDLNKTTLLSFDVKAEPKYALEVGDYRAVGEENNKRLFEKGETFSLGIRALKDGPPESEDAVSAAIYQFNKERQNYTRVDGSVVFANEASTMVNLSNGFAAWTGSISDNAVSGVYRLEFSYHDKIEYEDFIVK